MSKEKRLSDDVADSILSMITIEKIFKAGDKLPNENKLSEELGVSRTTLREAIRILVARNVLEIQRGRGTFVKENFEENTLDELSALSAVKMNADDLYEMRLIFEPEAAYYATMRASESELQRIISIGENIEQLILDGKDRTLEEQAFHRSIAKATHNDFMNRLMPVIQEAIDKGVTLSKKKKAASEDTIVDHRILMDFMKNRNAEGARNAMRIHILHAIDKLELKKD
ncbi:MAG: FadR family transcriptional regulator [Lachnospiraceae bacterium]|nr:FadR family transcriptional regulator [Lachnospiraceae bacterium]